MNVLIACEESQRVCSAFRLKGHNAFSCDILDCSGGHPEWHIKDDCLSLINGYCSFLTQDNNLHFINDTWDLVIAHPPCTFLTNSGQRWNYFGSVDYRNERAINTKKAIYFFMEIANCNAKKLAIENPVGIMSSLYRKPDFIYNPYDFLGETEAKKTCLWLRNLNPLVPNQKLDKTLITHNGFKGHFDKVYSWNSEEIKILRSKTPLGVASAMAEQWG